jgi:hypothetical protein
MKVPALNVATATREAPAWRQALARNRACARLFVMKPQVHPAAIGLTTMHFFDRHFPFHNELRVCIRIKVRRKDFRRRNCLWKHRVRQGIAPFSVCGIYSRCQSPLHYGRTCEDSRKSMFEFSPSDVVPSLARATMRFFFVSLAGDFATTRARPFRLSLSRTLCFAFAQLTQIGASYDARILEGRRRLCHLHSDSRILLATTAALPSRFVHARPRPIPPVSYVLDTFPLYDLSSRRPRLCLAISYVRVLGLCLPFPTSSTHSSASTPPSPRRLTSHSFSAPVLSYALVDDSTPTPPAVSCASHLQRFPTPHTYNVRVRLQRPRAVSFPTPLLLLVDSPTRHTYVRVG